MQTNQSTPESRPLKPVQELFTDTWNLYWALLSTFLTIEVIALLIGVLVLIAAGVIMLVAGISVGALTKNLAFGTGVGALAILAYIPLHFALTAWRVAAVQSVAIDGKPTPSWPRLKKVWAQIKPLTLLYALTLLATIGGTALFIVPGIIILVLTDVVLSVYLIEGKKGTDAMIRSADLIRPYFWPVLGRVALLLIGVGILNSLVSSLFGHNGSSAPAVVNLVMTLLTLPFIQCFDLTLYRDLTHIQGVHEPKVTPGRTMMYKAFAALGALLIVAVIFLSGYAIVGFLGIAAQNGGLPGLTQ